MSMSMRETLQNTNSRDDVMRAMQNSFARPNAAVGQSGLYFFLILWRILGHFGVDFWGRFLGQIFGADFWNKLKVPFFRK